MAVLGTPTAQAGQARVTGAALVDDDGQVSAVAGEAILAPGQLINDPENDPVVTINPTIEELTDINGNGVGDAVTELDIDFDITNSTSDLLEVAIADTLLDTDGNPVFDRESDIISLVKNFGGVSSPLGQAQVTGAAAFDTDNTVSAVAGQAELARGQALDNDSPQVNINPTFNPSVDDTEPAPETLTQLDIDFSIDDGEITLLEEAIADTVDGADFDRESDVISLVKAFTEESEGAVSEEVVNAGFE